jgi:hypothetical protein
MSPNVDRFSGPDATASPTNNKRKSSFFSRQDPRCLSPEARPVTGVLPTGVFLYFGEGKRAARPRMHSEQAADIISVKKILDLICLLTGPLALSHQIIEEA